MSGAESPVLEADVLIVGGGLAGLTCGVGLLGSGLRVVVVEGSSRLGGRAASWLDEKTGDPVHIGPHIFLTEYVNTFKLFDRLGTSDGIVWQSGRSFLTRVHGVEEIRMEGAVLPPPLTFVPSVFADKTVTTEDKLSNFPVTFFAMQLSEADILALDEIPAAEFLRSMGVSQGYIESFWAFTSMAIMNVPLERCSTAALLRFYRRLIGHRALKVGFAGRGLGDLFAPQARAAIEAGGGTVLMGTPVSRFFGDAGSAHGVELADGRRVRARTCVAALPPHVLAPLLVAEWRQDHEWLRDIDRLEPCPYVSPYLWFDRKLTKRQFWARAYAPDDLNCDFYDLSNIYPGWKKRPSLITSNIIYSHRAEKMSDEEIVAATRAELADYLPEAANAKLVHSVVHRIPMAIHCPYPGTERIRPETVGPIRGLLVAGDWIRTGIPSSMEGACMSGFFAAEEIWRSIDRPRALAVPQNEIEGFVALFTELSKRLPTKDLARSIAERWAMRSAKSTKSKSDRASG